MRDTTLCSVHLGVDERGTASLTKRRIALSDAQRYANAQMEMFDLLGELSRARNCQALWTVNINGSEVLSEAFINEILYAERSYEEDSQSGSNPVRYH
jgi:hypothetical protein